MKNYSFFAEWNTSKMLSLWELLRLTKVPKNFVIFKEGDESKCFYFVKNGEIEVYYCFFKGKFKKILQISKIFQINEEPPSLDSYLSKEHQRHSLNDMNLIWADARWRRKVRRVKVFFFFFYNKYFSLKIFKKSLHYWVKAHTSVRTKYQSSRGFSFR